MGWGDVRELTNLLEEVKTMKGDLGERGEKVDDTYQARGGPSLAKVILLHHRFDRLERHKRAARLLLRCQLCLHLGASLQVVRFAHELERYRNQHGQRAIGVLVQQLQARPIRDHPQVRLAPDVGLVPLNLIVIEADDAAEFVDDGAGTLVEH